MEENKLRCSGCGEYAEKVPANFKCPHCGRWGTLKSEDGFERKLRMFGWLIIILVVLFGLYLSVGCSTEYEAECRVSLRIVSTVLRSL